MMATQDLAWMLEGLINVKHLALRDYSIAEFSSESRSLAKDRVEILRVIVERKHSGNRASLIEIIKGSKRMERVILDGRTLRTSNSPEIRRMVDLMNALIPVCKKKGVELWRENFIANGKVNLDSE
jgi:hypothetical protein